MFSLSCIQAGIVATVTSPVSTTPAINTKLQISTRIYIKIRNGPEGILRAQRKLICEKKPEVENLVSDSL
jgi:hypothetical protein